jgi:NAD(P)-dependent dehydrogenase (short-subunit alcohol dehydrogenase family)
MQLPGKTAIITGGSSGIGRAIALTLAEAGASVGVGDLKRSPKSAAVPTAEKIREDGGDAIFRETDVRDADDCTTLVEATTDQLGGLDIVVNNAGGFPPEARGKTIADLSADEWESIIEVNLTGVRNCTSPAVESLKESDAGRIINIASKMGVVGHQEAPAYAAAKGGIISLTKQLAIDHAPEAITVNSISPGIIVTDTKEYRFDKKGDRMRENTPLPYLGKPEDVAQSALFLASDSGRFVTGHNLVIDGGWTAK